MIFSQDSLVGPFAPSGGIITTSDSLHLLGARLSMGRETQAGAMGWEEGEKEEGRKESLMIGETFSAGSLRPSSSENNFSTAGLYVPTFVQNDSFAGSKSRWLMVAFGSKGRAARLVQIVPQGEAFS